MTLRAERSFSGDFETEFSEERDIPQFPQFRKLTFEDKELVDSHVRKNNYRHCDFNFFGMWIWDVTESLHASTLNSSLVINYRDPKTGKRYLSFLGKEEVVDTVQKLLDFVEIREEYLDELQLVPEDNLAQDMEELGARFEVVEDRDTFDYVYSVDELAKLEGSKYRKQRNMVSRFRRDNSQEVRDTCLLDVTEVEAQGEILNLYDRWQERKGKVEGKGDDELVVLERFFTYSPQVDTLDIGVYVKDQLVGFMSFGILDNGLAMGYFGKADTSFKGIYGFLWHEAARCLIERGCIILNNEYDLGVDTLRRAKLAMHPTELLKKFRIRNYPLQSE